MSRLLRYSLWASVSGAVSPILQSVDRVGVGASLGAAALGIYSIPMSVSFRLTAFTSAFARTIFPRLSASGPSALAVARRLLALLTSLWTAIIVVGMLAMHAGLRIWLGQHISDPATPVGIVLLAGMWANGLAIIPYSHSYSQARPDRVAKIHLVEVLPFLAVLWLCLRLWGMLGAAFAWDARVTADAVLLFRYSGFGVSDLRALLIPAGLVAFAMALGLHGLRARADWVAGACLAIGCVAWAVAKARAAVLSAVARGANA